MVCGPKIKTDELKFAAKAFGKGNRLAMGIEVALVEETAEEKDAKGLASLWD